MKQFRIRLFYFFCIALLGSISSASIADNSNDDETLLKAAFIFNFAKLTSWPETTWNEPDAPLILCAAGNDTLVAAIARLGGKVIKGHPVSIRILQDAQSPEKCHVLYIATSESQRFQDELRKIGNQSILTVSEIPHFAEAGGIIKLYNENNRIRFMINLNTAKAAGLKVSSRLLRMAVVVGNIEAP